MQGVPVREGHSESQGGQSNLNADKRVSDATHDARLLSGPSNRARNLFRALQDLQKGRH
jgi:hypothetical protein